MPVYSIDQDNALYYDYTAPTATQGVTFVFFNPLTGDASLWQNSVVPALLDSGHGVLVYNMRGQVNSPFSSAVTLNQSLIVDDAKRLLEAVAPVNPVFVGLSIGGIFAAQVVLQGPPCAGLVLLNTLRRDGPRLRWINDVVVRLAETGGSELIRDVLSPLIMNETWQGENRAQCLKDVSYTPMDQHSGTYQLLSNARDTDWNFPYETLRMPVLVVTGAQDRVVRDPQDIETIYARLPNAKQLELPDAGHMIPVEQPGQLVTALLDLVS